MAESAEHKFLSDLVLAILGEVSSSRLYAYRETERRRFDFSCDLANNWKRVISGQTIWKHAEGIDKDARSLLCDVEPTVLVCIARDTIKNKSTPRESVSDFRNTPLAEKISRLRVFSVPEGLDADQDVHRELIYTDLKESLSRDLLLSIVLGGISSNDIAIFTHWGDASGLALATLAEIDRLGYDNYTRLGKSLGASASRVKERVIMLSVAGFIGAEDNPEESGRIYRTLPKGRVLLDICGCLHRGADNPEGGHVGS
jgi:hypothetical protein